MTSQRRVWKKRLSFGANLGERYRSRSSSLAARQSSTDFSRTACTFARCASRSRAGGAKGPCWTIKKRVIHFSIWNMRLNVTRYLLLWTTCCFSSETRCSFSPLLCCSTWQLDTLPSSYSPVVTRRRLRCRSFKDFEWGEPNLVRN